MDSKSTIYKLNILISKILETRLVKYFENKFPKTYKFVIQRSSRSRFSGLPLTILITVITLNLMLLFEITEDIINSKEFIAIDSFVSEILYSVRLEPVAKSFYYISKMCDIRTVTILSMGMIIFLIIRRKYNFAYGLIVSILGSGLSIYLGKSIFEIDRPFEYAYYEEKYFSFPSGHTTISVAFYGLILYYLIQHRVSVRIWSISISIIFVFWFLIGFSRLYLCVHYLSDVIAGYLLGFLWLLLSISIIEWRERKLLE